MSANFASFLYLVSGVLFILALRGLSHPTTSRQGNVYGMVGMTLAIVTTLALAVPSWNGFALIVLGIAIGGGIGAYIARTIAMPMPIMPNMLPRRLVVGCERPRSARMNRMPETR